MPRRRALKRAASNVADVTTIQQRLLKDVDEIYDTRIKRDGINYQDPPPVSLRVLANLRGTTESRLTTYGIQPTTGRPSFCQLRPTTYCLKPTIGDLHTHGLLSAAYLQIVTMNYYTTQELCHTTRHLQPIPTSYTYYAATNANYFQLLPTTTANYLPHVPTQPMPNCLGRCAAILLNPIS